jgi:hypothetical protein
VGGVGAGSSCRRPRPLLPQLRKLYLRLCLVPSGALAALLGLDLSGKPPSLQQQQWGVEGPSRCSSLHANSSHGDSGGSSGSSDGGCCLEVLSLTGDSLSRGDCCEAWGHWLAVLWQLKALQVRHCCTAHVATAQLVRYTHPETSSPAYV